MEGEIIHCLKCNDYIQGDLKGNLISCKCGACSIDQTPDYYSINGNFIDIELAVKTDSGRKWVRMSDLMKEKENNKINRIDKTNYYLNIAEAASKRSTCLKRHYGAIIVKNDEIISTGYNGAPRGLPSCLERGKCLRQNSERGTDYSNCVSCHAEMNAIISASRKDMIDSTMYLVGKLCDFYNGSSKELSYVDDPSPCSICKRLIINSGIKRVIVRIDKNNYNEIDVSTWNETDIIGGY